MSEPMNIWHHPIYDARDDELVFDCHITYDYNVPDTNDPKIYARYIGERKKYYIRPTHQEEDRKFSMNSLNKFLIITDVAINHPEMLKMKMVINGTEYDCNNSEDVRKIRSLIHFYGLPDL